MRRVDETSAGGLVLDRPGPDACAALIGRLDRRGRLLWSLPKGHVEAGETEEDTAVREVAEETGIVGPGRRQARHHRLLVRRRRPPRPQDRPPLPAARRRPGRRPRAVRRGRRGQRGRLGAAGRGAVAAGVRRRAPAARPGARAAPRDRVSRPSRAVGLLLVLLLALAPARAGPRGPAAPDDERGRRRRSPSPWTTCAPARRARATTCRSSAACGSTAPSRCATSRCGCSSAACSSPAASCRTPTSASRCSPPATCRSCPTWRPARTAALDVRLPVDLLRLTADGVYPLALEVHGRQRRRRRRAARRGPHLPAVVRRPHRRPAADRLAVAARRPAARQPDRGAARRRPRALARARGRLGRSLAAARAGEAGECPPAPEPARDRERDTDDERDADAAPLRPGGGDVRRRPRPAASPRAA